MPSFQHLQPGPGQTWADLLRALPLGLTSLEKRVRALRDAPPNEECIISEKIPEARRTVGSCVIGPFHGSGVEGQGGKSSNSPRVVDGTENMIGIQRISFSGTRTLKRKGEFSSSPPPNAALY